MCNSLPFLKLVSLLLPISKGRTWTRVCVLLVPFFLLYELDIFATRRLGWLDDENLVNRDPYLQNAQFSPFLSCDKYNVAKTRLPATEFITILLGKCLLESLESYIRIRKSSDCLHDKNSMKGLHNACVFEYSL